MAKAFTAAYGIKATGVKSKVGDTLEKMTREAQANNITIDVTMYEDGPYARRQAAAAECRLHLHPR